MSGFVRAGFSFLKNLGKGGSKTSPTISSTKINVGNLKKNQETLNKLKKTTDAYVTKAGSVDPSLKEALRKAGSKSLQKTEKILRKNRKDGGRMGLKFGSRPKTNIEKINQTFNAKKSDLDKDGKLSGYEKKRGKAIAQAMKNKKKII
jgi:hypothetical protein